MGKRNGVVLVLLFALAFSVYPGGQKETTAGSSGKVALELWTYWDSSERNKAWYDVVADFNNSSKNRTVNVQYVPHPNMVQQIGVAAAGGKLPDLIQMDNASGPSFAEMGILADMTNRVRESIPTDKYFPGAINSSKIRDRYFGLPLTANNICLYYNKDKFKQAGLSDPPRDWKEYLEFAKKLTTDGTFGLALAAKKPVDATFQFLPYLWMAGSAYDKLNSPETVKALQLYADLLKSKAMSMEILNWTQQDASNQFMAGKAAMYVEGPWRLSTLEGATFQWGVALLPKGPESFSTVLGGENIYMCKGPREKEAWDFVEWTQRTENMLKLNLGKKVIPPRKDAALSNDFYVKDGRMKVFTDMMNYARAKPAIANWPVFDEAIANMVQAVVSGAKTPEQAAKEAGQSVQGK